MQPKDLDTTILIPSYNCWFDGMGFHRAGSGFEEFYKLLRDLHIRGIPLGQTSSHVLDESRKLGTTATYAPQL